MKDLSFLLNEAISEEEMSKIQGGSSEVSLSECSCGKKGYEVFKEDLLNALRKESQLP